jgi:hypothetical protein
MKKIDKMLKQFSDLYEFNRRLKRYELKKKKTADSQPGHARPNSRTPQA